MTANLRWVQRSDLAYNTPLPPVCMQIPSRARNGSAMTCNARETGTGSMNSISQAGLGRPLTYKGRISPLTAEVADG